MFETSTDILNIVKAVSIFGLAFFISLASFYFAMILRQIFKVTKEVKGFFDKVDEILKILKDKIEHSSSHLILISEGIKKIVEIASNVSEKRKEKKVSNEK